MIKKLFEKPSFSLFNNYEFIEKLRNKVNELIENINSGGSGGSGGTIYSFDERVIGKWLDGNDIYQKTIKITSAMIEENYFSYYVNNATKLLNIHYIFSGQSDETTVVSDFSIFSNVNTISEFNDKAIYNESYIEDGQLVINGTLPKYIIYNFDDFDIYITIDYLK